MSVTAGARPPRVGLEVGAARQGLAGVGIYITELAAALEELAPDRVLRLGVRAGGPMPAPRRMSGETTMRGRLHLGWILRSADADARAAGCQLVHYTNAVAPLRASVPFVVTIQDMSIVRLPAAHPLPRLAAAPIMLAAARRARLVIVPSSATAGEVRRLLRVSADRIAVIPLAARRPASGDRDDAVLDRLGLRDRGYVLALGTIEPRKNHVRLLAAFERALAEKPDLRLVFVGALGWRTGALRRALHRSPVRERVVVAGHLPDAAVGSLLASCAVMAYPSVYEGFGLPIVEAMAAGAPVVTSRRSSMPEVAGGAAVLVDPLDVQSIADGVIEAIARRDELVEAGRQRATDRSWLDVGRETLAAYDRALQRAT